MTKVVRFAVRGSVAFPVDMLRYDACWPATQHDALEVADSLKTRKRRTIFMRGLDCTPGRWNSFGWEVIGPE